MRGRISAPGEITAQFKYYPFTFAGKDQSNRLVTTKTRDTSNCRQQELTGSNEKDIIERVALIAFFRQNKR